MANKNTSLHSAKDAKKDEFYTQLFDIENELKHYKKHFEDKTVFCNCDDPTESNFWQYFSLNFDYLKLKRLIATHYNTTEPSYMLEMYRDDGGVHTRIADLKQNGDFRSPECIALLKEADIVVTNPPFSLFREYVAQLIEYQKKFLIIGHQNAITYKEIFPLIKENKLWLGNGFKGNVGFFKSPYEDKAVSSQHKEGLIRVSGVMWFTNLDHKKRHEKLELYKKYNPEEYPTYDNYDAINCDKVADIPVDYCESWGVTNEVFCKLNPCEWERVRVQRFDDDVVLNFVVPAKDTELRGMLSKHEDGYKEAIESALTDAIYCSGYVGVPITFLDKYCPGQFEIVRFRKGNDDKDLRLPFITSMNEASKQASKQELVLQDYCSSSDVTEPSESQLQSSTNIVHNNLELLACLPRPDITHQLSDCQNCLTAMHDHCSQEKILTQGSLLVVRCNGMIGVPITFLDKFNPIQFSVIGLGIANLGLEIGVKPYKPQHKQYRKTIQKRGTVDGDLYMVDKQDHPVVPYARIIIYKRG